jgi:hypothetical protein
VLGAIRTPNPQTIGDHIPAGASGWSNPTGIADQIGVDETSVFTCEADTSRPDLRCIPAVIHFLVYFPLPLAKNLGEQLVPPDNPGTSQERPRARRTGVDPASDLVAAR